MAWLRLSHRSFEGELPTEGCGVGFGAVFTFFLRVSKVTTGGLTTRGAGVGSKPIGVIGDGIWVLILLLVTTNALGAGLGCALDLAPLLVARERRSHASEPLRSSSPTGVILIIWKSSIEYQEIWKRTGEKRLKCWALASINV